MKSISAVQHAARLRQVARQQISQILHARKLKNADQLKC